MNIQQTTPLLSACKNTTPPLRFTNRNEIFSEKISETVATVAVAKVKKI
jgi:hypothetical protein